MFQEASFAVTRIHHIECEFHPVRLAGTIPVQKDSPGAMLRPLTSQVTTYLAFGFCSSCLF